jgi:hypothetical protein
VEWFSELRVELGNVLVNLRTDNASGVRTDEGLVKKTENGTMYLVILDKRALFVPAPNSPMTITALMAT